MTHGPPPRLRHGVVSAFDRSAGYGTIAEHPLIAGVDSSVGPTGEWFFHCSEIADGSRSMEPITEVTFRLVPGHMGRLEAHDVRSA